MLRKNAFLNYKFLINYKTKSKKKFFNEFNFYEFIKEKSKKEKILYFKEINNLVF